ncbi:MAG: hypothetical protein IJU80_10740, partial [Lachnospiraceae bacterium]|nr:hypothetical protein [Lachnospiraceae bacterium]
MQIPLSFAVAYNGLIAGRTNRFKKQKDAFNILIKGIDSFDDKAFAESHVSNYVTGSEEIPKDVQEIFLSLSDEEINSRLRMIGIDRTETTVKMFHDFLIKTIDLDTEKKKVLRTLFENGMYEQYIVSALRFSFDYTGKQKDWMTSTIVKTLRELSKVSRTPPMKIEPNGFCNIPHRNDYFVGRK